MSDIRVTVPPLEDLKEAFAKFDTESSGAIPVHDLGALLRSVGVVELKEDELQALISEEMSDKNFDLPEFLALMVGSAHKSNCDGAPLLNHHRQAPDSPVDLHTGGDRPHAARARHGEERAAEGVQAS